MQRIQLLHRVVPRLNGTRTLSRTFVSSGPRKVDTPHTNTSNDHYNKPGDANTPLSEHPKNDDSLPNFMQGKLGQKEEQKHKSHATGESIVPEPIQRAAPEGLEKALPESVHPTKGSDIDPDKGENTRFKSHATGESMVPEFIQRVAPEKLEKALPESIHPTKGSDIDPDPNQAKKAK